VDAISEQRLLTVIPTLSVRVHRLEAVLGFDIRVTQALRNSATQDALWSQGRLPVEEVNAKRAAVGLAPITFAQNEIVTHAPPGHSWHEYGLAVDVVPMDPVPDFNETHPQWKAIVAEARGAGLLDGISFQDEPHLQLFEIPVSPTPQYQTLLAKGTDAVWAMVDALPSIGIDV
jgi:hypothetical protein